MLCHARHMGGRKKSKGSHFDGQGIPWGIENFCKDINFFFCLFQGRCILTSIT